MKIGDCVQLKKAINGRRFPGRVTKINKGMVRVSLKNGLYVEFPESDFEFCSEPDEVQDETLNETSDEVSEEIPEDEVIE